MPNQPIDLQNWVSIIINIVCIIIFCLELDHASLDLYEADYES